MFELQAKTTEHAEIRLYGTVSEWGVINAKDIDNALRAAKKEGYTKVTLRIHSPGGSIFEGIAVNSVVKTSGLEVHAIVDGIAASMGSAIVVASNYASMHEGTRMMIHQGAGGIYGSADQIISYGSLLKTLNNDLAEIYASKTGKDKQWILDNWMTEGKDTWFTAKEAKKEGLIDEVIPKSQEKATAEYSIQEMAAYYDTQLLQENKDEIMKSKLIEKYGLAATATDEEVMNAIEADKNKKPEVATLATAESVDAFMAIGKTAGLITDKNEAAVKAMAEKAGLKATSDFLATFEKPKAAGDELRLSDVVAALKGTVSAPKDKTWSEMTLAEKQALEIADPTKFEALFKASIGVVKNGESN